MPVIIILILAVLAYSYGVMKICSRGSSRVMPRLRQMSAFGAGIFITYIALASPLENYADYLLSAHMVQHLLLMLVAAPLLLWGRPMPYLIWFFPATLRRRTGLLRIVRGLSATVRALQKPATTWSLFCGVVVLWHIPAIYRWAMADEFRHSLMHVSFLAAGVLFWSVVRDAGRRRRLDYASSALFVFSAALLTGLPGALITFTRRPLYVPASHHPIPFGLTALEDQQLAGLIMWIPMDLILFCVALVLLAAALRAPNRAARSSNVAARAPTFLPF